MKTILEKDRDLTIDSMTLPKGLAFCDNMGVVNHGRVPDKPLSEKQVQAGILGHMKYLIRNLPARLIFTHVRDHVDRILRARDRTFQQKLQIQMDKKATTTLTKVVAEDRGYITTSFPFKRVIIHCGDQRLDPL